MRKAIRMTKIVIATVKAFVEYQILYRKNETKL